MSKIPPSDRKFGRGLFKGMVHFPHYKGAYVVQLPTDVESFMNEGNVIPSDRGTIVFMPFAFERLDDYGTGLYRVIPLNELTMDEVGLTQEFLPKESL